MNTHANKTQENKSQSVANENIQQQRGGESTVQFVDNRPVAVTQRKLQEKANNSPQVKQTAQLQAMADNHFAQQPKPIQKKESKTGLPDNLKIGIENLSGYSMDDVKVHYNSAKPAQLQAHAYAQGTDIHLASGQEKHLPHEAWHVVQQKQGRVKPTMQMKGRVNVNDDEGLEKEADVMGAKALQMNKNVDPGNNLANMNLNYSQIAVQRKVGFEFETGNAVVAEPKERVFESTSYYIDADSGNKNGRNIEFVTRPQGSFQAAVGAIKDCMTKADEISKTKKIETHKVIINDGKWTATAQATQGVRFDHMHKYLQQVAEYSATMEDSFYSNFQNVLKKGGSSEDGFAILVAWYIKALQSWEPTSDSDEGPKNATGIMSRTDFYAMYQWIKDNGDLSAYHKAESAALADLGVKPNEYLIQKDYIHGDEQGEVMQNKLTVKDWLASFRDGTMIPEIDKKGKETGKEINVKKDAMSPPQGFRYYDPVYSMGALEMDNNLAIIESRSEDQAAGVPINEWLDFADNIFTRIKDIYKDINEHYKKRLDAYKEESDTYSEQLKMQGEGGSANLPDPVPPTKPPYPTEDGYIFDI